MARFTNYATLSYAGGTTDSNTVVGELLETLAVTKTAVINNYTAKDDVTYVISITNSGTAPINALTVTDDLGGYLFNTTMVYPLEYKAGSLRYYINGALQTAPTVTAGPPLVISGINIPAGGNAILIYEANVTNYAPLDAQGSITNTATVTGTGLATPLTATEIITVLPRADLTISKALSPATVTENGQLTYTFVVANTGSIAATADDQIVLTDTFSPVLNQITVTLDGTVLTEGTDYTYDTATGVFATVAGKITVPAATYAPNTDGTWAVTPGTATLTVTGTV